MQYMVLEVVNSELWGKREGVVGNTGELLGTGNITSLVLGSSYVSTLNL